jgi:sulfatase maturation enzyme AslB (radical SAM superfamily)
LDLEQLDRRLADIPEIDAVELYGGEVTLLDESYVNDLKGVVRRYYDGPISVTTNFYQMPEWIYHDDIDVNVSYDFNNRPHHEQVFTNLLVFSRPVNVIVLATPEVLADDVDQQIELIRSLVNLNSVEIKPYSPNQANDRGNRNRDYVEYVKRWIHGFPNIRLRNIALLNEVADGVRNAFSDDHVYITPEGKFGVLEFDEFDREYFLQLPDFKAYQQWTKNEKHKLLSEICRACEFKGRCLTEHYRRKEGLDGECSGYKSLIEWWLGRAA